MKNKLFIFFSLVMIMIGMIACRSTDKLQLYRFEQSVDCDSYGSSLEWTELIELGCLPRSIVLKNDSILQYFIRFGGLGSLTTVKYYLKDNLITIDSLDIYGKIVPEEITNMKMIYSRDSLINSKTREKYYNQKYLDKLHKKYVKSFPTARRLSCIGASFQPAPMLRP